ncbi:MAG: LacI family DNA-binding transcriptional regulator [Pirellulales bacterium]|nr:LacI family DNA-binding transcriptional regulator [Pirellulales bacterium]
MKATIRDVAREAGVSIGTVSRVLNGNSAVSEESRTRVSTVVRSLNYYPLRKRRVPTSEGTLDGKRVAIVLLGMDRSLSSLPVVAAALHGVEAALAEGGATVSLIDLPRLDHLPTVLKQDSLDGLILKGPLQGNLIEAADPVLIRRLSALPSVWCLRRPDGCWGDSVAPNDLVAGRLAAEHLLAYGHKRVAFLNPRADHATFRLRGMSFAWHAEAAGANVKTFLAKDEDTSFPRQSLHSVESVQSLLDAVLAESPRPTAIFVPCDSIALLVYRALTKRKVHMGEEISLISCNCEPALTAGLYPTLTTMDVHAHVIGRTAVAQLAMVFGRPKQEPTVEITIEPTLVSGGSVVNLC